MNHPSFLRMALLFLSFPLGACATSGAPGRSVAGQKTTILFLCPHGGAKSLVAACYFNRRVRELSLPYEGVAAAAEDPYKSVPEPVAELLKREGLDVRSFKPRSATDRDLRSAGRTISIGCDIGKLDHGAQSIESWDDVPMMSENLEGSVESIRSHIEQLIEQLHTDR